MDRKSIVILIISFILLMLWFPLVNHWYPPPPVRPGMTGAAGMTNRLGTNSAFAATNGATAEARFQAAAPTLSTLNPHAPEELVVVENDNARYTFTSYGGGIKLVELKHYEESVDCNRRREGGVKNFATLNTKAPIPALALLGDEALLGDGVFQLTKTANGIHMEKALTNGLTIVKDVQLSTNYMVNATLRLENRSNQPIKAPLQEWVIGTATPIGPKDLALTMGAQWYDGSQSQQIGKGQFTGRSVGCSASTLVRTEFVAGASNVVWAAVNNQFFTMIAVPKQSAPMMITRHIDLPPPTPAELAADSKIVARPFGFQAALLYPEQALAPHDKIERNLEIYVGPKEYNTLARLGAKYGNNLDLVMNFGGFFGFFAKALLLSMNGLHLLGLAYGAAIILITVIIKLVFWPLTRASTRSMKRMSALQPQMKALQEKYKDDPRKMNQKLMEFMKEHKVSPLGGCLPMMLQIPVFFGFYRMLQSAIELRGASFLWACDLSQPDTIFTLPGLNFPVNPLPMIMGVTMLWQARLTPPSPGMDPEQQKIKRYMPMMFMVFLYRFSAGLTLYWTVQNMLTIAQMKLTKAIDEPAAPGAAKSAKAPVKKLPPGR